MKMLVICPLLLVAALVAPPARAQQMPTCATGGASSVIINGKPALRLSDVASCPLGMFEPVAGVSIEGEPAVRLVAPREGCIGGGSADVIIGGAPAGRAGDVTCLPN
ncbi:PAAR domain-containing protein [Stappia sp. ICDLI1TA098]